MNTLASNEMLFLQCLMANPGAETTRKAVEWVKPEMMAFSVCSELVGAFKALQSDGCPITKEFILARFPWSEAQSAYIEKLDAEKENGCDLRAVSVALAEDYRKRAIRGILAKGLQAMETGGRAKDHLEEITKQLAELSMGMNEDKLKVVSVAESMKKVANGEPLTPQEYSENVVATGIPYIDDVVKMTRRSYGVIAAVTSAGKSTLAIQMATRSAQNGRRSLIVSLEMDHDEVHAKAIGCMTRHNVWSIQTGRSRPFLNKEDHEAAELISTVCAGSGQAWSPIEVVIRDRHKKEPLDIVFIDYLTLLEAPEHTKSANLAQRFGELSKSLRRLSQELKIAVVIVCQFNREAAEGAEPFLKNLRESGQIENDCSWAILLWNPDKVKAGGGEQRVVNYRIAKNRLGKRDDTGTLIFEPSMSLFLPAQRSN